MKGAPTLIGLDQNRIIALGNEAVRLHAGAAPASAVDRDLLEMLHHGAQVSERLACPSSQFTAQESGSNAHLAARNQALSEELSGGFAFREFGESLRFQIHRLINDRESGVPDPDRRQLFINQDGYQPRSDSVLANLAFRVDWSEKNRARQANPEVVARKARMARIVQDEVRVLRDRDGRARDFIRAHLSDGLEFHIAYQAWVEARHKDPGHFVVDDRFHARKLATYRALFPGQPFRPIEDLPVEAPWDYADPAEVDGEFARLVNSGELAAIDSAQVYSHLMIELSAERRTGHQVTANDAYDVLRAAVAVPAVSIYATDGLVKSMLHRCGLAERYRLEVFDGSRNDVERLRDRISRLAEW
jgi:hypothetical protein